MGAKSGDHECSTYITEWVVPSLSSCSLPYTLSLIFTLLKGYHSTVLYTSLTRALITGKSPAYLVIQGLPLVTLTGREVCWHHL